MNYFETTVIYETPVENTSAKKKVKEHYLVDAISLTEAESIVIKEMAHLISGEFSVTAGNQKAYEEVLLSDYESDDRFYNCKLYYIISDEKTGKEKRTPKNVLVQSDSVRTALGRFEQYMKGTIMDYVLVSISETKIIDIFKYKTVDE